jgi:hypothetical protein
MQARGMKDWSRAEYAERRNLQKGEKQDSIQRVICRQKE